MINHEQFYINSDKLLRRYLDSDGFIHIDVSTFESSFDYLIHLYTFKYIKEYLKILKDIIKDTYSDSNIVIDELVLLKYLKELQDNTLDSLDTEKHIAVFIAITKIKTIINSARIK